MIDADPRTAEQVAVVVGRDAQVGVMPDSASQACNEGWR